MKTLAWLFLTVLGAGSLQAQGWVEPPPGRIGHVVKTRTVVTARVVGRVAQVEVEEWFRNDGGTLGEGDYLYPLPGEAVFSNFSLFQGDNELRGETMDAAEARAIYEEIVRRKRDPALIELAGHGLIRARIFPIAAGETRKITLRFSQVLDRIGDGLQYRYAAGIARGPVVRPVGEQTRPRVRSHTPVDFTLIAASGDAFRDPFSPTHELDVRRSGGRLEVRPVGTVHGDLSVVMPFARSEVGINILTHREPGDRGYFMLTLTPNRAPRGTASRDVSVVVDVSGSMSGHKLEQARTALHQLLGTLGPDDRFRLIAFSTRVRAFRAGWTSVDRAGLREARAWLDALSADGGTNIADALEEGFRLPSPVGRLPIVLFLTDGLPSVGEQDPERLAERAAALRDRARVLAFGVGHDVNTYLLDGLTAAARGATQYVQPGESVEEPLSVLAAKIQHPVLTDLTIDDAPVRIDEVYPVTLPDLFAGEDLVVFGRYEVEDDCRGAFVIAGNRSGAGEQYATDVMFPAHRAANDFIPRLWASRKIGVLAREIRLRGSNDELVDEIRRTALRYGLLSEYTSYLVQEPTALAVGGTQAGRGQMMPAMAPKASVGEQAVARAERSRRQREVTGLADLDENASGVLDLAHMPQTRQVAGRLFKEIDGTWTDLSHTDGSRVVRIAAFSDAYFAVLAELPELESYVTAFASLMIAGESVSIAIGDDGRTQLSANELSRLVRGFRGR
jgi:Ca-activated chloride channel family protein